MASEDFIPKILVNDGWGFTVNALKERTKFKYIFQSEKGNEIVDGLLFLFLPTDLDLEEERELAKKQFREIYSLVSNEIFCICISTEGCDAARLEEDLELKKLGCPYTLLTSSFFEPETYENISSWFQKHINESCSIKPAKR